MVSLGVAIGAREKEIEKERYVRVRFAEREREIEREDLCLRFAKREKKEGKGNIIRIIFLAVRN